MSQAVEKSESPVRRYEDTRFWHRRYHKKRFNKVLDILGQNLDRNRSFLDAGAGTGEYLASCRSLARRAVGIDVSLPDLKSVPEHNVGLVQADITRLPFRESSFDVVLCSEVLEHIADFESGISELFRVGSDTIVVTMPCISDIRRIVGSLAKRIFGMDLKERDQAVGHINMVSFDQIVQKFGFGGWATEVRAWYIFCEPLTTYPIPSLFSPLIGLVEKMLGWFFPRIGNHAVVICHKKESAMAESCWSTVD